MAGRGGATLLNERTNQTGQHNRGAESDFTYVHVRVAHLKEQFTQIYKVSHPHVIILKENTKQKVTAWVWTDERKYSLFFE